VAVDTLGPTREGTRFATPERVVSPILTVPFHQLRLPRLTGTRVTSAWNPGSRCPGPCPRPLPHPGPWPSAVVHGAFDLGTLAAQQRPLLLSRGDQELLSSARRPQRGRFSSGTRLRASGSALPVGTATTTSTAYLNHVLMWTAAPPGPRALKTIHLRSDPQIEGSITWSGEPLRIVS
jgi:hypothetical protein